MKRYQNFGHLAASRGLKLLVFTTLLTVLSSCGLLGRPDAKQEPGAPGAVEQSKTETQVAIEELERKQFEKTADIEVLWQIPEQPVDGFVIRYGYERDQLDRIVEVPADLLEKIEDPAQGIAYRYLLHDIPTEKRVYLTVSAYKDKLESEPSAVFVVEPDKAEGEVSGSEEG